MIFKQIYYSRLKSCILCVLMFCAVPFSVNADTQTTAVNDTDDKYDFNQIDPAELDDFQSQLDDLLGVRQESTVDPAKQAAAQQKSADLKRLSSVVQSDADAALSDEDKALKDTAFKQMINTLMPLSGEEVREIKRHYNDSQRAFAFTQDIPPRPTSTSMVVDLNPGATPPVIRLSSGFVTSLLFVDSTGAPWPIKAYDIGNPQAYNIQWPQDSSDDPTSSNNTLLIQSVTMYKQGNLAVMLEGLNTPVMITLLPGQRAIDYRVDMQVPRMGPNATPHYQSLPFMASPLLLDVLNGIAPEDSKALKVIGGDAKAYFTEDKVMYLRTPYTVISPSWVSTMTGVDGSIHAYEMPPSSVVLALREGKMIKMSIEGF